MCGIIIQIIIAEESYEMDKQLSGTFHEKMREAWHTFVSGGEIDEELVRPEIAKSWLRSREYGVDPRADLTVSDGHDISDRLKKSSMLITAAREPVAALAQMVKGTGFRINLTDSEGYFLISEGDEAVLQRTSVLNSHIGVCRNESSAGTCGISLSLIEDKPIQVNSFEHYNKYLHDWTCSSAPIHDQSSNIVGVLNISGHYTLVHRHTLGMVVGLARAIELAITNQNSIRQLNRCGKISNMIIQEAYEGVVIFDGEGKICLSNQRGIDILSSLIGSRYITSIQLLRQHTDIFDFDRGLFEREISIVIEGKRKSFYMTVRNRSNSQASTRESTVLASRVLKSIFMPASSSCCVMNCPTSLKSAVVISSSSSSSPSLVKKPSSIL